MYSFNICYRICSVLRRSAASCCILRRFAVSRQTGILYTWPYYRPSKGPSNCPKC